MLRQLGERLRLHRAQEHARVDRAVEAAADRVAAGREVDRRHTAATARPVRRACSPLLGPAQQRIAAERDADRGERPACSARKRARIQPISRESPEW
jgi:hypothetical protein